MTLLTWPGDPLPIRGEMLIGGAWTDVTSRIRLADEIQISGRGKQNEQGRPSPCSCTFTLNNRDGLFSNRNPISAYYGKLGRNTPVRFSVTEHQSFAILDTADASRLKTTDKASLRITGDIDISAEIEPDYWTGNGAGQIIASRYRRTASSDRSWVFFVGETGYLNFWWSADGSANTLRAQSTTYISNQYGPLAVRVTLDVNNGAAGRTATFYTADSIAGPWTQLGTPVVQAGVTSIWAGVGELEIGRIDDGRNAGISDLVGLFGKVYAFQMRNGINGTLVANADVTARARGTTSWSDGLASPNTWTTNGNAEITPDNRRFYGEVSALPQAWDLSGKDVYVPVQASDVTRRLTQGATPISSAMRSYFSSFTSTGYFPMEDGGGMGTTAANVTPGGRPANITNVSFTADEDLPASAGVAVLNSDTSRIGGYAIQRTNSGYACFNVAFRMQAIPASATALYNVYFGASTIQRITISSSGSAYDMNVYGANGALLNFTSFTWGTNSPPTSWVLMSLQLTQSTPTNINIDWGWYSPNSSVFYVPPTVAITGKVGRISSWSARGSAQNVGTRYAHFFMGQFDFDRGTYAYAVAASAFNGENAADRFERICAQNGIASKIIGDRSNSESMGPQFVRTFMETLYDCVDTEQGQFFPDRSSAALVFRTRRSISNQYGPTVTMKGGYDLGNVVPLPTDDDLLLRNHVTASRPDGSGTAVSSRDVGPNSTQSPSATPPGVGVAPMTITRNPFRDDRMQSMAQWESHLGTWDEARWPNVKVLLERQNFTGTSLKVRKGLMLARLDVGSMFTLSGMPTWLPPDDALLMVQGIAETLGNRTWQIMWNTSPYGPYIGNTSTLQPNTGYRAAASNSTLAAGFTSTATSFTVSTPTGALWGTTATKPGNFPLNIVVGGEVISVSGITGTGTTQTFTVAPSGRSINGIVKAHVTGESVQLQKSFRAAL